MKLLREQQRFKHYTGDGSPVFFIKKIIKMNGKETKYNEIVLEYKCDIDTFG